MPIIIDLQVTDKKTDDSLSRLEKALERLEAVQTRFNDSLKETADRANQAAGAFGRMASGASRASSASSRVKPPPVSDPARAMQEAQRRLSDDPNDKGALLLFNQARRKLNGADPEKQLMTAIMRTRFTKDAAGKLIGMPLGVDLARFGSGLMANGMPGGLAGGMASAGKGIGSALSIPGVGILIGAIALSGAAMLAFVSAVNSAARALGNIAKGQALSGGYGGQLLNLNAAAGGNASGMAQALQSGLSSGFGPGYAVQAGINPVGGPFGDNNYAAKLQKALKFIANSPNLDTARRRAEGLGIPEAANTFNLGARNKSLIGGGPQISQAQLQASADFEFNMSRLGASLERLNVTAFGNFVGHFANFVDRINNHLMFANEVIKRLTGQGEKKDTAVDQNTKAIKENTQIIDSLNREFKGAGPRARGAVPEAIRGGNWEAIKNARAGVI